MRMLRQWLARLDEDLYSSRPPGASKRCHYTQRCACLTPTWSLYYCTEQRYGVQLTPPPLSITVWEESSRFVGQTPSVTATCERRHTNGMLEMRSVGDDRVDWSHTPETSINYHQAGPNMEPTRKEKKRTSKKYVEKGSHDRHKEDRVQLEGAWKESPGQKTLEDCGQRPMPQEGRGVKNAYSIHWHIPYHNYIRHNTPFYTFNKDNLEKVTQVKQGHGECLSSKLVKYDVTLRRFSIKAVGCEMLAKQVLKAL